MLDKINIFKNKQLELKFSYGDNVLLNIIYVLSHKHLFKDGHEDDKLIGAFFSKKKR